MAVIRGTIALIRPDRLSKWIGLVLLAVVVGLLEAVGAGIVLALLGLATQPEASMELPVVGDLRAILPAMDDDVLLAWLAGCTAIFFIVRAALKMLQSYAQSRIALNAGARISIRLARGYLTMPYELHLQRNSAEMVRNTFQTVGLIVNRIIVPGARLLAEVLIVLSLAVFLLIVEPLATVLAAIVMGGAVLLLLKVIQPRIKRYGQRTQASSKDALQAIQQSLQGQREIRLLGRTDFFVKQFARAKQRHARASYLMSTVAELPKVTIETSLVLFILAFFGVTVLTLGDPSEMIATLGILAYVGFRVQPSLQKIAAAVNNLKFADASVSDLDSERRLVESTWSDEGHSTAAEPLEALTDRIAVSDLTFVYPASSTPALDRVSLQVLSGESIGICGPTGGGKSTLIDVVTGLLPPTAGAVTVDGVDIRTNLGSWQRQLGVVSQSIFLLDDTLRRNIAFGYRDRDIDEATLARACQLARLDEVLASLPDGLQTTVGERGVRLSGGQRQRVAIARALYRDPSILIFDEGTSALDGATEAEFMRGIERLRGSHTVVMVAHRLSTVRKCDRIYFVEDGRIGDAGTYDELVERNPVFREMAG